MSSTPYATLQKYYHVPDVQHQKFAIPEFGGTGFMPTKPKPKGPQCHVWRQGDYDGRVLMAKAYPQCNVNSGCAQYTSKY